MKALSGDKRLFWISIIIVELVLFYVVWRPHRDRFKPSPHRIAMAPPAVQRPETKPTPVVIPPGKPLSASRSHLSTPEKPLVVNASLKSPEPIPALRTPPTPLSPPESFWCHIAMMESNCDCKVKGDQRADNLVRPLP